MTVRDGQSGLAGVEIEIHDPQGRWPKVSRAWEAGGSSFTTTITWDRKFTDGTLAPPGAYDVVVKAFDRAGNLERITARLLIPAPGVTPTPLATRQAGPVRSPISQPTASEQPAPPAASRSTPLAAFAIPSPFPVDSSKSAYFSNETHRTGRTGFFRFPWWLLLAGGAAVYAVSKGISDYRKTRQRQGLEERAASMPAHDTAEAADKKERVARGIDAVQNANAWLAEERVIEPEIRRLQILNSWEQADYWRRFPGGTAGDLTVIEGIGPKVQKALQEHGYRTLADLASARPEDLQKVLQGQRWYFMDPGSWVHQARLAAIGNEKGLQAVQGKLKGGRGTLPEEAEENLLRRLVELEEIAENRRFPARVLDGVDSVSDVLAIGGNLAYAFTGQEAAKNAGDVGDALGILDGIRQIAQCSKFFGQGYQGLIQNASSIGRGVTLLGKVTGVLSIVTGLVGMVGGGMQVAHSLEDGKADAETWIGALNGLAGLSAIIGGIMLLVPGAQPVAGVLLGASAVLSGVATIIENREWISATFQKGKQIAWETSRPIREPAARIIEHGGEMQAQRIERRGEQVAGAVRRATENTAQFIEGGAQAAGRAIQVVSQAVSRGIETLGNATAQGVQQVTQLAAQTVSSTGQALARGMERAASAAASWARPFSPALANGIERAGQSVSRVVTNVTQRVSSTVAQAGQAVSSMLQRGTQAAASAVSRAGQTLASGIVRAGQGAANFVRGAGQAVSSSVCTVAQAASSVVRNLTSSFANWLRRP